VATMRRSPRGFAFRGCETLRGTGIPLWVADRRTVGSQCDVDGTPFRPDGELFGRAATRLEAMGVGAVLVNCLPPSRVVGVAPWLRRFTGLPLGGYANIGQWRARQWWWDGAPDPAAYAAAALGWVTGCMHVV